MKLRIKKETSGDANRAVPHILEALCQNLNVNYFGCGVPIKTSGDVVENLINTRHCQSLYGHGDSPPGHLWSSGELVDPQQSEALCSDTYRTYQSTGLDANVTTWKHDESRIKKHCLTFLW
ncbi:hypothetical protein OSB04_002543 [Centaurea solstitialis]|uniref:Uncharacterized protein n=1 Tax=Centaurea solstitialis TaxID=347529 RepID=A0AA38UAU4_9ASTR|nr:hypothetical protein OSB04_002543 [Centaurea solstitialis]